MPITIDDLTTRQNMAAAVGARVDSGTGDATGDLQILTSADVVLATVVLANPAFGSPDASAIISLLGVPLSVAITADGVAAKFRVRNRANAVIYSGNVTVTGGGGSLQVATTAFVTGATTTVTSGTFQQPAT